MLRCLPRFFCRAKDDGFLAEAEFAELGAEAVHLRSIRLVLGEGAFLEEQQLVFGAGAVVDDGDEEAAEVDFDAGEEFRERRFSAGAGRACARATPQSRKRRERWARESWSSAVSRKTR